MQNNYTSTLHRSNPHCSLRVQTHTCFILSSLRHMNSALINHAYLGSEFCCIAHISVTIESWVSRTDKIFQAPIKYLRYGRHISWSCINDLHNEGLTVPRCNVLEDMQPAKAKSWKRKIQRSNRMYMK